MGDSGSLPGVGESLGKEEWSSRQPIDTRSVRGCPAIPGNSRVLGKTRSGRNRGFQCLGLMRSGVIVGSPRKRGVGAAESSADGFNGGMQVG